MSITNMGYWLLYYKTTYKHVALDCNNTHIATFNYKHVILKLTT